MPNWCFTSFSITGPKSDLDSFVEAITLRENGEIKKDKFGMVVYDLTQLYPTPEELKIKATFFSSDETSPEALEMKQKYEANIAKYGYPHWYEWCWAKWGTKWPPNFTDFHNLSHDKRPEVLGHYETAWAPCDALWVKVSEQYPNLTILTSYTEESDAFLGASVFKAGVLYEVGTDFSQESLAELDSELLADWLAHEAKMEEIDYDYDHPSYDELQESRHDLKERIRDYCGAQAVALATAN